ncbi:arylsulfatase [Pedobacter sp. HDW13]|uniref:sulfatase family protein n=1 Tax=unclassified Pedobacter TaxID=2628915 RepID=UPI000F5B1430|nr:MULTISPECIES: arylsulfatase [unclassified Pedobacter]QIL41878.1 arylsulfatase [Pedobacter sp. HDW13]RQO68429.1 arylsulfatase [Pedobacter sp. KBW01]
MKIPLLILMSFFGLQSFAQKKPNVILICADDLGYGDLSCYGATKLHTPNLDKLAAKGIRFTNGHSTSATCTPARYALMTGEYPWRKKGTGILPGDAALIIPTDRKTLPKVFKEAGYQTAIVGKWHLGLGDQVEKNWNGEIKPGPNEVGFGYSFIFPATADRVPTVFLQDHQVVALDKADPIAVDYKQKIGDEPTGKENPELLKMKSTPGQGHDNTIVNGIGRIGFMTGGKMARWVDEELSFTFLTQAKQFIASKKQSPFFLYFALTEPHVPRMPATMFKDKSGLGARGDAILQLDWTVGEIMKELEHQGIAQNTMIVFTSDNGPVLDDGYQDEAVTRRNGHTPAGTLRGGKYSALEGGTRVPFIINWPAGIKPAVSDALVSQIDFIQSFAALLQAKIPAGTATDSENQLASFLGKNKTGRSVYIEQGGALSIIKDNWKYITPEKGPAYAKAVGIETGNLDAPQLYDLSKDKEEKNNLAATYPDKVKALAALLAEIKSK